MYNNEAVIMSRHQVFRKVIKDGKEDMELIVDEKQPELTIEKSIEERVQILENELVIIKERLVL